MNRPLTIGLTGPTGSGKSTLRPVFESMGCRVLDCDVYARRVVMPGSPALGELAAEFGEDIIRPDGQLDRGLLAQRAFCSGEKTKKLNAITHPYIISMLKEDIIKARAGGLHAVIDAPLLFEAGLDTICDATIAVTAPREVRIRRVTERDGISREKALMRISAQRPEEKYIELAQYHISSDCSPEELARRAESVIREIIG